MSTTNITSAELIIHSCLWDNCNEFFASLPDLAAHIATVHMIPLSTFNCKWRSCHNCTFQTKYLLIQHIYSYHLSVAPNYVPSQGMVRANPYYPYYYYNQEFPSNIYQAYIPRSPYTPYPYHNPTFVQNIQSRLSARAVIFALENIELILNNNNNNNNKILITNSMISSEQNSLRQRFYPIDSQSSSSSSSSSLVVRQYKIPQFNVVTPSQIVKIQENVVPSQICKIHETDDSPQCFSNSKAPSTPSQKFQEQFNSSDLREEIEELRNLLKEQSKELNDKTQELDKNTKEMEKMSDDINEKSKEISKLKSIISLKDSEINIIKESLELQTNMSKILQEQNRRADDKLRRMWAEMLCRKADLIEKGRLNGYKYDEMNINDRPSSRKRVRKDYDDDDENSDLHPMELPASPHENISIITKAMICNWEGCGKSFRTKLALKAHVVSSHMGEEISKVSVINP
ncbi:hypothetical protein C1645_832043 [Glomus cerebriforme]|uniref:C2H2-type domain-containing protein n=1 Tax=Glomus cerebriforme TaxID=658196 RepID=A0A397SIX0_9GLOM|nr:hypothetical protein C1645_832043 [Glomus cerebriforme]